MGVYPIEKFQFIEQKQFEDFILTCYEASRFTGEGKITGVMNAGTSLLIGSVKPNESLSEADLKKVCRRHPETALSGKYPPSAEGRRLGIPAGIAEIRSGFRELLLQEESSC